MVQKNIPMTKDIVTEKEKSLNFFMEIVFPEVVKVSKQKDLGFHGLGHTIQNAFHAIDISLAIDQDPMPVLIAVGFHDAARTDDGYNEHHGEDALPLLIAAVQGPLAAYVKDAKTKDQIINAVRDHTTGMNATDPVSAALWDADRLRLSWERGYDERFYSTSIGKKMAQFSVKKQISYAHEWNTLMQKRGYTKLSPFQQLNISSNQGR